MSEAQLTLDIEAWLYDNARGHEKAKPRRHIIPYLRLQGHSLPQSEDGADRAMRRACRDSQKIGSCSRGYFYIVTSEDRAIALGQLHSQAMSELVREKRIREAGASGEQGELF